MQRSTYPLIVRNLVQSRLDGSIGGVWNGFRRTMASDSWGQDGSGSGSSGSKTSRVATPRASATSTVISDAGSYSRGTNTGAFERRINREDNMWRDRSYIDTKWLNPRDPTAYRPNFRQTEPTSLRKQFMRSPDEVSREVMGRDWEETVKTYKRTSTAMSGQKGGTRNEAWQAADSTRNRQQHLQLMHMQQQQEQQQKQQQQQQPKKQQQQNYWGRGPEAAQDQ
ncbi:myb-like protein P [Drosophila biarmipes]|uniref:myb-like protein P n=1 Tax=Drosophila biarmipes TaxID=125945 RepID=UPI0007E5CF5D|nr:myb-like protein P [Drosophila biarmipes]